MVDMFYNKKSDTLQITKQYFTYVNEHDCMFFENQKVTFSVHDWYL